MAYIPEDVIQEIKEQTDIVDIASQYIQLSKKGRNYLASCPFHEDRSPSFTVSQEKQIFKCFSCGRGGNVFGLVSEMEGLTFPEAVLKVADMNNIPIDARYSQGISDENKLHQPLKDIHQKASEFYQYYLMSTTNGQEALDYLLRRGLSEETLKDFKIGLAPAKSELLYQYLAKEGYSDEQLVQSGIFFLAEDGDMVDRFRKRIIFPLSDQRGVVLGFSGRTLDDGQKAKYLNSPDTPIFNKSNLLYNLDQARHTIRQESQVLIMEGFMDVIALWQAGVKNAVATMGTALTSNHLNTLTTQANEIVFVFDGDDAGQKATKKAFELGLNYPKNDFKSVTIPQRMDPDEWIKNRGVNSFKELIANSDSYFEFMRDSLAKQYNLADSSDLARYIEDLVAEIAKINSPIERQLRIQELVNEYDLKEDIITEQISRQRHIASVEPEANYSYNEESVPQLVEAEPVYWQGRESLDYDIKSNRAFNSEKEILYQLLHHHEAWEYMGNLTDFVMFHEICQKAYYMLQEFYYDKGYPLPMVAIIDIIEDTQVNTLLTSLLIETNDVDYSDKLMDDCVAVIKEEFILLEIDELKAKAKEYSLEHKDGPLRETMTEIIKLTRSIK